MTKCIDNMFELETKKLMVSKELERKKEEVNKIAGIYIRVLIEYQVREGFLMGRTLIP